jgi:hypothetical protein
MDHDIAQGSSGVIDINNNNNVIVFAMTCYKFNNVRHCVPSTLYKCLAAGTTGHYIKSLTDHALVLIQYIGNSPITFILYIKFKRPSGYT